MRILEWSWKNYKSYGAVVQNIKLNQEKGELILLVGKNGMGKSAAISALELACFGQEQNKKGTRLSKKNFPNRINGDLLVNAKLETDQFLDITRTMPNVDSPLKTKLVIDKIPFDKANKIDGKIIEKIGFDYNTYKSFISMNVNNFKDFISLSPEEKRMLLDKLFNLEQINELNKLLKQLQKNNDIDFSTIAKELAIYTNNVEELQDAISKSIEKKKINNDSRINEINALLEEHKENYEIVLEQGDELSEIIKEFNEGINKLILKERDIQRDIREVNEKIALFESGHCPTCHTELTGELNLLPEYEEKKAKLIQVQNKLRDKIDGAREELAEYGDQFLKIKEQTHKIINIVTSLKQEKKSLRVDDSIDMDDFNENIEKNKNKIKEKESEYVEIQKMKTIYSLLLPIWGENGIKRDLIDSILTPLNEFINEDLEFLKTRFKVTLDNNFDAHIFEFNKEIDTDSLSSGEAKKINLVIMLSYIKILRMKRDINILFLDEVFATIDIEGIDDILILFKKFANDRNINVFLVHHSELKEWFFDKIINVRKTTFSYIETKSV